MGFPFSLESSAPPPEEAPTFDDELSVDEELEAGSELAFDAVCEALSKFLNGCW